MLKNILIFLIILGLGGAGYVYYSSQLKPEGVSIASDVTTGVVSTGTDTIAMTGTDTQSTTGPVVTGTTTTVYTVAPNSLMGWKGTKPTGFHTGTIAISSGSLSVANNQIVGGSFTVDMTSIQLLDIQDEKFEGEIKEGLFEASKYPVTTFEISGTSMSGDQVVVEGTLTIKGISNPIKIPTKTLTITDSQVVATAEFAIERSKRGLTKREGMVNEYLEFSLNLTANK